MKKTSLLTLFFTLWFSSASFGNHFMGAGSSGGGFRYTYTSFQHLTTSSREVVRALSGIPSEEFNRVVAKYTERRVNQKELREIILNVEFAPELNRTRLNSHGNPTRLSFDYSIEDRKIIALAPFFNDFNKVHLTNEDRRVIKLQLIHEATHVFGIGISDDQASFDLSKELYEKAFKPEWSFEQGIMVLRYRPGCGANGSVEDRILACNSTKNGFKVVKEDVFSFDGNETLLFPESFGRYQIVNTLDDYGYFTMLSSKGEAYAEDAHLVCNALGNTWRLPTTSEAKELLDRGPLNVGYLEVLSQNPGADKLVAVNFELKVKKVRTFIFSFKVYDVVCVSNQI